MLTKPTDFLSKIDRPAFQAALAELPFIADGPRVGLLVVLGRADASLLDDSSWWRGFGWSDILAISSTPLSALIAAREGLMNMVQVIADQTAAEVTTRSGLAVLLGGPRFALEHVSPATMRLVFDRVAKADGLLARWLDEISARPERERLAERVAETESQAREARQSEAKAREELDELSEQLADVQRQLAVLQEASVGLSTRERRQVFIDAAKVVAQVAATVEGDGRALDHDALSRKVGLLAERFGLQTDDLPGATVAFDPERHSAPGARPDVGEPVNVARAGYTWNDGSERVVVLPALVTRASQNGENGR
jgi:molecular chaperone GrpE (heat shock protein)